MENQEKLIAKCKNMVEKIYDKYGISPNEAKLLQKLIEADVSRPIVSFEVGDYVRVVDGPFRNFTGFVAEVNNELGKLKALVKIFVQPTPVELEFWKVERIIGKNMEGETTKSPLILMGAIVGDIVGSRFEFNNCFNTDFELFTPECRFTDDTVCTIAVADAILRNVPFVPTLQQWGMKGYLVGYGAMFASWLCSENPQPYNSYGNGAAMRVSPCGWFNEDRETVLAVARRSAECTHSHPEGIKGALAVADCILYARQGAGKTKIARLITKKYAYNLNKTCDSIRYDWQSDGRRLAQFDFDGDVDMDKIAFETDETCQKTVPQAIVAFLESKDFEDAIRLAISIGGDSDTIGAITGSIAEAYYGGVPDAIAQQALTYLPPEMKAVLTAFNERFVLPTRSNS